MTAIAEKAKLNLTSVTPPPPPTEVAEFDTTTPIDVSIVPFTQRDTPNWGPWIFYRLSQIWPHFTPLNYMGWLAQKMNDNGALFIRSKYAVMLAVVSRETFNPRPVVDLVFVFKHHPDDEAETKFVRILVRHMEDWARGLGADGIRILHPDRCDMTFSRAKDVLWGDEKKYLLKTITK